MAPKKPKPNPEAPKKPKPDQLKLNADKLARAKFNGILASIDLQDKNALNTYNKAKYNRKRDALATLASMAAADKTAKRDITSLNDETSQMYQKSIDQYSKNQAADAGRRAATATAGLSSLESQMKQLGLTMDGGAGERLTSTLNAQASGLNSIDAINKGATERQGLMSKDAGTALIAMLAGQYNNNKAAFETGNNKANQDAELAYNDLNTKIDAERLVKKGEKGAYALETYHELQTEKFNQEMKQQELANQEKLAGAQMDLNVGKANETKRHNQATEEIARANAERAAAAAAAAAKEPKPPKGESAAGKYMMNNLKKLFGVTEKNKQGKYVLKKGSSAYEYRLNRARQAFNYLTTTGITGDLMDSTGNPVMDITKDAQGNEIKKPKKNVFGVGSKEWEKFITSNGVEVNDYITNLYNTLDGAHQRGGWNTYHGSYGYKSAEDMLRQTLRQYLSIKRGNA